MRICLLQSFFGRTYNNLGSISECKNNGECVINKKNRTSCKACRLRKCLLVGMSKSGSRYGRRSNWFKIHCLLQEQVSNSNAQVPLFPGGQSGFYPAGLLPPHFLTGDKFPTEVKFPSKKRKTDNNSSSSDESAAEGNGSSTEEDSSSRSNSVLSFLRQAPSPFSDKQDLAWLQQQQQQNRKVSATVTLTLPPSSPPYGRHFPGVALSSGGAPSPRDLLLYSPAVGVAAVEQDQPIDLSVRAAEATVPSRGQRNDEEIKSPLVNNESEDSLTEDRKHTPATPLDLTLRPAEVEG